MTVEFLAVQALLECPQSPLSLHSALVAKKGKGVVILGPNEAGKSTLACALWQRGWSLLCDDVALIEVDQNVARPTPRRVSLRDPSRQLLGETVWRRILTSPSCHRTDEGYVFHPYEVDGQKPLADTRLAAVIFLARRGVITPPATLQRIDPARTLLALLPYSNFVRVFDPGEALCRIQLFAATVPAYNLGRGPLTDMVHCVECLLEGA